MLIVFNLKNDEYTEMEGKSEDPFLHVNYEPDRHRLVVASDFFGTAFTTYLALEEDKFYISDSLFKIQRMLRRKSELNTDMLPHFFYNGFLPGSHTLIKGIYKLPPKKRVIAEDGAIRAEDYEMEFWGSCGEGRSLEKMYDEVMLQAVSTALPDTERYNLALSGGFDSNCLLHLIKQLKREAETDCYSVGGSVGIDETTDAAAIAGMYENLSFHRTMVTSDTLKHLDEIVYRLEGSVYERGIFLQYELAKMLHEDGCTHLICGECADQVFHVKSYGLTSEDRFLFGYQDTPYEMASYVVLKKSAVMLHSFGIRGIYPYLDEGVIRLGYMTRMENGDNKEFHKSQCKRLLPQVVFRNLKKIGGSTELLPLMDAGMDYEELCKTCRYYDPEFRYTEKYSKKEAVMDYYLSLKYIESFERQFCDHEE